jgi:thiamine biosynthesis protein ThiS
MKVKNKIKITVNGKQIQVISNFSLKRLIAKLKIPLNKIAIELNKKIIDKKRISKIYLQKGDKIEIVHFIGGG